MFAEGCCGCPARWVSTRLFGSKLETAFEAWATMNGADAVDQILAEPTLGPWRGWCWSGLLMTLSLLYLVYPDDLIPDSAPYGLTDDMAVLAIGLTASLFLLPATSRLPALNWARFRIRVLRADLGNFGPLQHRYVHGFVFSGKNSGSHWVKYMLSLALAEKYGLAPPLFCSGKEADRIVGRADRARSGRGYPQIATSHTIPSILLAWVRLPSFIRQPPIVLLVRDIPDSLASGYRKWQDRYRISLSEFVRGDPAGKRFIADIWWYMHFFNRWGAMVRRQPDRILLVRYEELLVDPEAWLARIAVHLRLDLSAESLTRAASLASKDRMRELQDPDAGETIVPSTEPAPALSPLHRRILRAALRHYLRSDFGYGTSAGVLEGGTPPEIAAVWR
jgi:hypothetical protein